MEGENVLTAPRGDGDSRDLLDGEGGDFEASRWLSHGEGGPPEDPAEPDFPRRPERDWYMIALAGTMMVVGVLAIKVGFDSLRRELS